MYKKAYLFLNGEPPSVDMMRIVSKEVAKGHILTVCADGAFCYVRDYFLPAAVVGDFDSVPVDSVPQGIELLKLPTEKDYTDGHVSMEYIIERGATDITIYGATGKRADHTLSNYSLLAVAQKRGVAAKIDAANFLIMLAEGDFSAPSTPGKIVSLVPYSDEVHILYTKGLKYPIDNKKLDKVHILGISNIAEAAVVGYNIAGGSALVFLEK